MRITKFGHACVRFEHGDAAVVVDPGVYTDPAALAGATAVLITHEHPDHYHPDHLRSVDVPVWTIGAVADRLREDAPDVAERVTVVAPGERFEAGLPVTAVGELHAVIHPEFPRFHNSGYLLELGDVRAYHPGDALTPPGTDVDLLCLPVSAPWLKASEAIDFARDVGAPRNLAIHDRIYSEAGLGIIDGHLDKFLPPAGQRYERLADGTDVAW
ncbi:MBL fold metallo-hydrolase [Nocardioides gansuensis]|uniref:MBL fold metallo-hydrolase n=1 Tax=Nocardioides gansuensis TaxID=2138300 RepID=A0A2T8FA79_9ACTN|nr:MBL fold metallo-hydrolase [Nocardioides gansuensis]PVG82593.1 MBL fold metallo-hydrolase [Nocardioides gansuensis]